MAAAFVVAAEADTDVLVVMTLSEVLLESEVMVDEPDFAVTVATMTTVRVIVEVVSTAKAAKGRLAMRTVDRRMVSLCCLG